MEKLLEKLKRLKKKSTSVRKIELLNEIIEDVEANFLCGDWQPIETMPKDGTRFLVYFSSGLIDKCWSFKDLLFFDRGQNDTVQNIGYTPTHWKPLPPKHQI